MDEVLDHIRSSQRSQSNAALELWNARLELLREAGSFRHLVEHIGTPLVEAGNNCECNTGCNVPCGSNCGALGESPKEYFVNPQP